MRQRRVWSRYDHVTATMVVTRNNHVEAGPATGETTPVNMSEIRRVNSREKIKQVASSRMVLAAKKASHRKRSRELRCTLAELLLAKRPISSTALPASASKVKTM